MTDIWKIFHNIMIFTLHAHDHYIHAINILHLNLSISSVR